MTSDIRRIRRIGERPSYGALWRRDMLFSHSRSVLTFHISRSVASIDAVVGLDARRRIPRKSD